MAEKYQQQQHQQMYPLAPSNIVPRSDAEESASYESMKLLRKNRRMKCIAYMAVFTAFHAIIILVLALVLLRAKSPKLRLGDINVVNTANANIRLAAEVRVKNTNFGRYKFDSSLGTLKSSGGVSIGQFVIPDGRARMKSTKKLYVIMDVTNPSSNSGNSSNSGMLELISQAELRGKVEFLRVFKRKKSAEMDCSMTLNLSTNVVQDLRCK